MAKIGKSGIVTLLKAFNEWVKIGKRDRFLCDKLEKNSNKARMAEMAKMTKIAKMVKISTIA